MTSFKKRERQRRVPLSSQSVPSPCNNIAKLKTRPSYIHVHTGRVKEHIQTFHLLWRHQNRTVRVTWQTQRKCMNEHCLCNTEIPCGAVILLMLIAKNQSSVTTPHYAWHTTANWEPQWKGLHQRVRKVFVCSQIMHKSHHDPHHAQHGRRATIQIYLLNFSLFFFLCKMKPCRVKYVNVRKTYIHCLMQNHIFVTTLNPPEV